MEFDVVFVFVCLTSQRQCLLSRNICDVPVGVILEPTTRKEDQVFKIIDNVLKQVFGEEATTFIYKYIEQKHQLRKSEFSKKIDSFAKGLEEFLSSGAFVVKNKILEDLVAAYGAKKAKFEKEYDFANQMRLILQKA